VGGSVIIKIPAYDIEVGDLVYNKYKRTFNKVDEVKEVYMTNVTKEVLDLEYEIYKEYKEDERKKGFNYFITKVINLIKNITLGDPKKRVLHRIDLHNVNSNNAYVKSVAIIYKSGQYDIVPWYDNVQIKQNVNCIPID